MTALEENLKEYTDLSYRVALSGCRHQQDAEDVVQNVMLKLFSGRREFADEDHLRRWIVRVTVNECKDLWRSPWKVHTISIDEMTEEPIFSQPEYESLYEALRKLDEKYRIVVHLYYYEGYSVREIAGLLHRRETTVQTQLMRARNKLKEQLKEDWL
ncbi:MAG: sigma-70 family RNA polymerase sigma factor [Clostridiales bacterium]|nr:sigma-70 family RNA polymerase sigma factor [Clostridiales bacterium]